MALLLGEVRDVVCASRMLSNGLRVYAERDATAPVVSLAITYDVGSRHEAVGRTGLAHLFEHLMFRGSAHVPAGGYGQALQAVGARFNAMTANDWTTYHVTMPVGALDTALWLEADRLATLPQVLDQQVLDAERLVVKNERRERIDDQPYGSLQERLMVAAFPVRHPYRHLPIGSMADLDAASLEDVVEFFRRHYTPANAQVVVIGDIDPDAVLDSVERYFGGIVGVPKPPRPAVVAFEPLTDPVTVDVMEGVPTPLLAMVWRLPVGGDPRAVAADMALSAFHGPQSSVVERLVRVRRMVYDVSHEVESLAGGAGLAVLVAEVPATVGVGPAEKAVHREIERFLNNGPTQDDLDLVQMGIEVARLGLQASVEQRAILASQGGAVHDDVRYHDDLARRALSLTLDDVRGALDLLRVDRAATIRYPAPGAVLAASRGQGRR